MFQFASFENEEPDIADLHYDDDKGQWVAEYEHEPADTEKSEWVAKYEEASESKPKLAAQNVEYDDFGGHVLPLAPPHEANLELRMHFWGSMRAYRPEVHASHGEWGSDVLRAGGSRAG